MGNGAPGRCFASRPAVASGRRPQDQGNNSRHVGSGITYAAEYDWKPQEGKERPAGVERDAFEDRHKLNIVGRPEGNEYTVAVGDLCFNIVGDIVNRRYEAVRYQPTAIVIVNSPVLCPDLRDAVRSEWTKLTPEEHRRSLLADATKPDWSGRADGGISRLLRYYPDAAASAVLKRLDAPLYDWGQFASSLNRRCTRRPMPRCGKS